MIGFNKAARGDRCVLPLLAVLFVCTAGCAPSSGPAADPRAFATLNIGFGLTTGETTESGIRGVARSLALEGLLNFSSDGRPHPRLAEKWSVSSDGLTWTVWLRPGVAFHNGQPATAAIVRDILAERLPDYIGPAYKDIREIRSVGDLELQFLLNRRSTFLLEGLDVRLPFPGQPEVGIGPFALDPSGEELALRANPRYYEGQPAIDRIVFKPYASVRSAWADMLRARVDMLYDVSVDALDSMQPSNQVKVFTFERPYQDIIFFNFDRPVFRDRLFRQTLNAAIDRQALANDVLNGHGSPADGPVWFRHWAYDDTLPKFRYQPVALPGPRRRLKCILGDQDATLERLALSVQRQLQAIGVDLELELVPIDKIVERIASRDFELLLADAVHGPTMIRPYYFWHSGAPFNYGNFASKEVDLALDGIRDAPSGDELAYKRAVASFQHAIIGDPPAIFLTWTERARAVSTRFEVPVEPGRDILSTLQLWRPLGGAQAASGR